MLHIELLTVLKLAHAVLRFWYLVKTAIDGLCVCSMRMIGRLAAVCLPAALSTRLLNTQLFSTARHMVNTRSVRRRNEGIDLIAERLRSLPEEQHEPLSSKFAAVLVPLFQDEDGLVKVWLTQRTMHLNSHKGEVALPGGKRDPTDPDDAFTAMREAHEEMGLQPDSVQVLCRLAPFVSKHLYSVTPVVAQVPADFDPKPNPDEVDAVFSMPLSCFLDAHNHIQWDVRSKSQNKRYYRVHSFDYQGYVVWGLTAAIMIRVAELALGRPPDFEVDHPSNTKARM